MRSWDDLCRALVGQGYREIQLIEIECSRCGAFRIGLEDVLPRLPCPRCCTPAKPSTLGRGLTRRPTLDWERVAGPTPAVFKADVRAEVPIRRQQQRYLHAPTGRPQSPVTAERIALAAKLYAEGCSRIHIARQLFPEQTNVERLKTAIKVFFHRHYDAITSGKSAIVASAS